MGSRPRVIDWEYGASGHPGFEVASIQRTHGWQDAQREALEQSYCERAGGRSARSVFRAGPFAWVDYIGLLWALLMAEQQPGPDYQALIDLNRQRLE